MRQLKASNRINLIKKTTTRLTIVGYQTGGPNNCPSAVEVPSTIGGKAVAIVGGYNEDNAQKTPFDNVTSLKLS